MDVKIENIIEKLKKEGVEGAQKESDELIKKAKKEASDIVTNAKKEAEKIIEDAQKKSAAFEDNRKLAIQQAARDGELLLKSRIEALFNQVFKSEVGKAMKPDFIQTLIFKLAEQWSHDSEAEISISESDLKELETLLKKGVKKNLKTEITLKASQDLMHGFRIGLKGDDVYYDFSDESIAEILKMALNPRLKDMLDIKNG